MRSDTVLITGVSSQDGALLSQLLLGRGFDVHGTVRRSSGNNLWRLDRLGLMDSVHLHEWHLEDAHSLSEVIRSVQPSAIFHLAADSFTWDSVTKPYAALSANILGTVGVLEGVRQMSPDTTVVLAGSSEVFGRRPEAFSANELTPHCPSNPYGVSKSAVVQLAEVYRNLHGLQARVGILFNHESELRSPQFVTRKVAMALAAFVRSDQRAPFKLGNLTARRDWGSAREYVQGLALLATTNSNHDVVFGTGRACSVLEWVQICGKHVGLDISLNENPYGSQLVDSRTGVLVAEVDSSLVRRDDLATPVADTRFAKEILGWSAETDVRQMAEVMMQAEIDAWAKQGLRKS